jgi:hypothetical protein
MREIARAMILQCWWEGMCWAQFHGAALQENFSRMKFEEAWNA